MEKGFVFSSVLVILFLEGCFTCFQDNSKSNRTITTTSSFYEECCCEKPESTVDDLQWLDPYNNSIGPGTDLNVYIEKQENCVNLHISSTSKTLSGTYRCITMYNGVSYSQTHHLDVYDPPYFINTTRTQYLVSGQDSMIRCKARSASSAYMRWYRGKDGQNEIKETDETEEEELKYKFMEDGLVVKNASVEDGGIYKCTASVSETGDEIEIDIDVMVMTIPVITEIIALPESTIINGTSLSIGCKAEGLPLPDYTWRKISPIDIANNETRNTTWQQNYNEIRFDSVEAEDAGIYECYAHNFAGNTSQTIEIKVLVPPRIISFHNRTVVEGSNIVILCNASGTPLPSITITYRGKNIEEDWNKSTDLFITDLSIIKVDRFKEGFYLCDATNEVDSVTELMYLTVWHPPHFDFNQEKVWGWNGENVNISCEHEANPPANLTWRYTKFESTIADELTINEYLNYAEQSNGTQMTTLNISEDFEPYGVYECTAKNDLGAASKIIELRKGFVPPPVQNETILESTATSATFEVDFSYYYEGPQILGLKAEYDVVENYNVTHIHPNRTWAIGRPFKLEKLKPNSTYLIKFAPINKVGAGEWGNVIAFETLTMSAPEPPIWEDETLQFSPSNVLKWKEPEDNGEPIDYYALRYCPKYDEEIDVFECKERIVTGATEQELSDLQFNTTYYFEIVAHNAQGNSTSANASFVVPAMEPQSESLLSGGAIIGISVVVVFVCLLLLDLLLLFWRRQGVIAGCCFNKNKKKPNTLNTRDKKGLLKDNGESTDDTLRRPNNGHREYEYNKTTGIITGKHSSV